MKNSFECVKCDSIDVIKVPGGDMWSKGYFNQIKVTSIKQVLVTRFVCLNCGYSEEWIEKDKDLDLIEKYYGNDKDNWNPFV